MFRRPFQRVLLGYDVDAVVQSQELRESAFAAMLDVVEAGEVRRGGNFGRHDLLIGPTGQKRSPLIFVVLHQIVAHARDTPEVTARDEGQIRLFLKGRAVRRRCRGRSHLDKIDGI